MSGSRKMLTVFGALVVLALLVQVVPYGRSHTNPPGGTAVTWDSPQTQELAKRACFDCHSNETRWPWYASIAPMSWRIQSHVTEGREKLNFSAFNPGSKETSEAAGEAKETVTKGEMPPRDYMLLHPEARLTAAEKRTLANGLGTMFAAFTEGEDQGVATRGSRIGERAGKEGDEEERGEHERDEHERGGDRD